VLNPGTAMTARRPGSPLVLALPRGGVPVAVGVARALGATLDVLLVRKIGHPDAPELGLGAIAEGAAEPFFDQQMLDEVKLTRDDLVGVVARERAELARRAAAYGREPVADLAGQLVVVVDDGLATGVTARAALHAVRARGAARVVLAVPVGSPAAVAAVRGDAAGAGAGALPGDQAADMPAGRDGVEHATVPDAPGTGAWPKKTGEVVTLVTPRRFRSVGEWYADFGQLTDADVLALLSSGA
jgi:putative phosphoribosyl transferase